MVIKKLLNLICRKCGSHEITLCIDEMPKEKDYCYYSVVCENCKLRDGVKLTITDKERWNQEK